MAKINFFEEIGQTGVPQFAGVLAERYDPSLQGPEGIARMASVLREEPSAFQSAYVVSLTAKQAHWVVRPGAPTPGDKTAADFVDQCLADMSHSFWETVRFALSSQAFGFADMEIVWKRRMGLAPKGDLPASLYDDGLIGIRKLAPRRQETIIKWDFDENGGPQAMWQRDPETGRDIGPIPVSKMLHFIGGAGRGSWEGMGWLEPAYRLAYLIKQFELLYGIGQQRAHIGLPVFEYQQSPDAQTQAAVRALGRGLVTNEHQYVSYPAQVVKFRMESVENPNATELRDMISQQRWELQGLVLASFLRLGTTGTGSRALAGPLIELFRAGVNAALDDIADVLSRYLVPRLLAANPNVLKLITRFPEITHSGVRNVPFEAVRYLQGIQLFLQQASPEDATWLRELVGMPENAPAEQEASPAPSSDEQQVQPNAL